MTHYTIKDVERFWSKVDKSDHPKGCWIWRAGKNKSSNSGYGRFWVNGNHCAHRVAYELANGTISDDLKVLHQCDNPLCVNPEHLFLGTQLDNVKDMANKGRRARFEGEGNGRAVLTWDKVREIRRRYKRYCKNDNQITLAEEFGVAQTVISSIVRNEAWIE